jgi:dTDP-4-dehydrorhamnose 3,5-epimerase
MRITRTTIPEVVIVEPDVYRDDRGALAVAFQERPFAEAGLPTHFAQDNHSCTFGGVVRALHYQLRSPQGKLVTVVTGAIFDVAVDIRVGSPTFGRWFGTTIQAENPRSLWVPPGFAHGFAVLSDRADVIIKCTTPFDPQDQFGVLWNDADINVAWPVSEPTLSEADSRLPTFREAGDALPRFDSQ